MSMKSGSFGGSCTGSIGSAADPELSCEILKCRSVNVRPDNRKRCSSAPPPGLEQEHMTRSNSCGEHFFEVPEYEFQEEYSWNHHPFMNNRIFGKSCTKLAKAIALGTRCIRLNGLDSVETKMKALKIWTVGQMLEGVHISYFYPVLTRCDLMLLYVLMRIRSQLNMALDMEMPPEWTNIVAKLLATTTIPQDEVHPDLLGFIVKRQRSKQKMNVFMDISVHDYVRSMLEYFVSDYGSLCFGLEKEISIVAKIASESCPMPYPMSPIEMLTLTDTFAVTPDFIDCLAFPREFYTRFNDHVVEILGRINQHWSKKVLQGCDYAEERMSIACGSMEQEMLVNEFWVGSSIFFAYDDLFKGTTSAGEKFERRMEWTEFKPERYLGKKLFDCLRVAPQTFVGMRSEVEDLPSFEPSTSSAAVNNRTWSLANVDYSAVFAANSRIATRLENNYLEQWKMLERDNETIQNCLAPDGPNSGRNDMQRMLTLDYPDGYAVEQFERTQRARALDAKTCANNMIDTMQRLKGKMATEEQKRDRKK